MVERIPFKRITKSVTEIVAETTVTIPTLVVNKPTLPFGKKRVVRFDTDRYLYVFDGTKEKAQAATITDYVTVTNPSYDRDHNDGSYAYYTLAAGTESNIRLYDFGVVKTCFVYTRLGAGSGTFTYLEYSTDGATWTVMYQAYAGTGAGFRKISFRYLRWRGRNTSTSAADTYMYSVEVFDPDDYVDRLDPKVTKECVLLPAVGKNWWVILDCGYSSNYYIYDVSDVAVTHQEGLLEVE